MAPVLAYVTSLVPRSSHLSPLEAGQTLRARTQAPEPVNPKYQPGALTADPTSINNRAYFALFALLGAAMVLAAIWFFFWAKNGGFHFRKGDWEDYKSTVLRRKGPNGTTLSGATKTTKLGGGSIVANGGEGDEKGGKWKRGAQKKKGKEKRGKKNNEDEDVRAYRHEKPAKVGGLNGEPDGVLNHDFAYTDSSLYSDDISSGGGFVPINTPPLRAKKGSYHYDNCTTTTTKPDPITPTPKKSSAHGNINDNNFYTHTPASNASTDSHRPLRPNAAFPGTSDSTPTRTPRNSSPRKSGNARHAVPSSFYTEPLDFESR
ncbi:MAG: hypothetical protein Q9217_001995, partial [Psora testacea]